MALSSLKYWKCLTIGLSELIGVNSQF